MSGTVQVRRAVAVDASLLQALAAQIPAAPQWSAAIWKEVLLPGGAVDRNVVIAEVAGEAAGFAVASLVAGVAEIESIAVAEAARRRGIGRLLTDAVLQWVRERSGRAIELEVRASNAQAIAFYEALGFREQARRVKYYSQPTEDALLFSRSL